MKTNDGADRNNFKLIESEISTDREMCFLQNQRLKLHHLGKPMAIIKKDGTIDVYTKIDKDLDNKLLELINFRRSQIECSYNQISI